MRSYGVKQQNQSSHQFSLHLEEITNLGFTVVNNIIDSHQIDLLKQELLSLYEEQTHEISLSDLQKIKEVGIVRCPLIYKTVFRDILKIPAINSILKSCLGENIILNQQNGIIVESHHEHHQAAWHRDLPYQEWISSRSLAVSVMFCLDTFNKETGGTFFLPGSHKYISLPSRNFIEKWQCPIAAEAGSVIIFDAMLYHRAGNNTSGRQRIGINHMYSIPLLKQQIDIPLALQNENLLQDEELFSLLGYKYPTYKSAQEYRNFRLKRLKETMFTDE